MVFLYHQAPGPARAAAAATGALPRVTVQLPLYNEMYVVDRLLDVRRADPYPKELLEIQVLDDSTDETQAIASAARRALPRAGLRHPLHPPRRPHRLQGRRARRGPRRPRRASSSLIFDADFVAAAGHPREDASATSTIPKVGMVQARWGHINRDYSLLTQVQSMLLDGHFILEHGGRNRSGRFFNFNGTGGHLAPRRPSRTRAAGSTTRSPRTSTSATARR